jgi:triphosphoribosyl-dephospho-CoA synthetase
VRNLAQSAIEEVLSFKPGNCHACRELHEDLKAALMEYLLTTTNIYVYGQDAAEMRIRNVEFTLHNTMLEFHAHRKDTHFADYFALSWLEMPARNAS